MNLEEISNYNLGAWVTAVATVVLVVVTAVLAIYTKQLAKISSRPQIVVSIKPNKWSSKHLDYSVANVGNATAFDIKIEFSPPLMVLRGASAEGVLPFQNMSILKPDAILETFLGDYKNYANGKWQVRITWSDKPKSKRRTELSYQINLDHLKNSGNLGDGNGDPLVALYREFKKFNSDVKHILKGSEHLKVDIYNKDERNSKD